MSYSPEREILNVGKCEYICDASDEDWKRKRAGLITASEVASLFNRGKWFPKTAEELADKKLNGTDTFEDNLYAFAGRELEVSNMNYYAKVTGASARPCNALFRSKATPLLGSTIDGITKAPRAIDSEIPDSGWLPWLEEFWDETAELEGWGLIEMKNSGSWFGNTLKKYGWDKKERTYDKDVMPYHYWTQVQCQLYVTGLPWGILCAKVDAADLVAKIIMPDEEFHKELEERVASFWKEINSADANE